MNLKSYILIFVFCHLMVGAYGRERTQFDTTANYSTPVWILKFSPLALIEIPQPSVQFAIEYRLSNALCLQHEIGWLPPMNSQGIFESGEKYNGGKFKTELRFYFEDDVLRNEKYHRSYLAFEGLYRIRVVRKEGWYHMNTGAFSQWLELYQNRQQFAFHVKYGKQARISRKHGVYLDYYAGIGLRKYYSTHSYITKDLQGIPDKTEEIYDFLTPSISLGFKLGIGH